MKEFWSSRIQGLTPYTPGEQPRERKYIKLNTNENPYPPSPKAVAAIQEAAGSGLRLYPDPEAGELVEALAQVYGVEREQVFVGNGSDEVLAFAFQAFFDPGAAIVFPDITYSFYPVYAAMFGIQCRTAPLLSDFSVPLEPFFEENGGVVLANPNAPTGMELSQDALRSILEHNPSVAVIVDEAYVDFGGTSALPLIREYPNLLVVQTTSKSRALAGLRVGFAFGNANLIAALNCVKNSIRWTDWPLRGRLPLFWTSRIFRRNAARSFVHGTARHGGWGIWVFMCCPPRAISSLSAILTALQGSCFRSCGRTAFWCAISPSPESGTICVFPLARTMRWTPLLPRWKS